MANDNIVTTKFKVDISDLKKGIGDANQQIKLANAQFKAATAGMDDWSKSAQGIQAKLKQLDSVIEAQKQKLAIYREQLERQEKAYKTNSDRAVELRQKLQELADNGVDKTSKEYKLLEQQLASVEKEQESNGKACDKLRIQILDQEAAVGKAEKEFRTYQKTMDAVADEAKDLENASKGVKDGVSEAGDAADKSIISFGSMQVTLGALCEKGIEIAVEALKKLAAAAVEAWKTFDEGRDVVIRLTGATGEMAKNLTQSFANVSRQIYADSSTIAEAVGEVNTRFGLTGDELEDLAKRYLKFSEITESDVVASVDDTQKALAAFGLNVNSAKDLLDALAATSQKTGVDTNTLTQGLISNGTAFQEMGLSIQQSVKFMGMLETSGANSETVLNGMRKALKNATKEGKPLSQALIDLENDITNAKTSTEGLTAAYDVFGKSGDQIYGALKNGTISFREIATAAVDSKGAVESTFEATRDVTDEAKLAVQNLKTSVAEVIDKFIQDHGPEIIDLIQRLSDHIPQLIDLIGRIGDAFAWVETHIDQIKQAWNAVSNYFRLTINPIGAMIRVLSTLFQTLGVDIGAVWESIKQAFQNAPVWFRQKFDAARTAVSNSFRNIGTWFSDRWNDIKNAFSNVGTWFRSTFEGAWQAVKNVFSNWGSFFGGLWSEIKNKFSTIGTNIASAISSSVRSGLNGVISSIESIINSGIGLINGAIGLINKIPGVSVGTIGRLSLPRLARGGVLEKGQVGLLEGSGAEAVVPLENNRKWIRAVAASMADEIGTKTVEYNFTQNIYSPEPLSRIEIYRQTRNQINFAKMKAGV